MILSQYLIGPGFVPQRLPQQMAAGTKKSMLIGSHLPPPPASIVGSTGTLTASVPYSHLPPPPPSIVGMYQGSLTAPVPYILSPLSSGLALEWNSAIEANNLGQ